MHLGASGARGAGKPLFSWEVDGHWDVFRGRRLHYADVLGPEGVARFRQLAEERWSQVRPAGPGDRDAERWGASYRITLVMERLAELAGDVDELVAVKSRDLSMPYDWLEVAEVYAGAGRHEEALDWARWAMVIEVLAFSTRGLNIDDVLHIYGNCIRGEPGFEDEDFLSRVDNMDELQDDDDWVVAAGEESMIVRGRALPVADREGDELVDVFRDLVPSYRDLFLADEEELRRRVPRDLPRVLMLDEWLHPDVTDGARPSESETFVLLADVLVDGRPELYRPARAPNTHWSNWPDAGNL